MNEKVVIGIDLGGTKMMTGAINTNGKVLCPPIKVPTNSFEKAEDILKRITNSVEETLHSLKVPSHDILGIGIGSTGPLDIAKGIILECPQLPTMNFYPLKATLEEYFKLPVFMNNDANCLIYGETIFGAGAKKKNVVGFTLGTGIGCAIIIDGKILNGSTGTAGEVWISPYLSGTIEDFISGAGVSKIYKTLSGKNKTSLQVFKLAEEGDSYALKTWETFGRHLAVAVAWSINLIDPELIILGGSIAHAHKYFLPAMHGELSQKICPMPAKHTKIALAGLGDNAGFIGAACLVIKNFNA